MATITFGGLATGLNTNSIVDGLIGVERRPITLLQKQQGKIKEKVSLYQDLSSKIGALKTAATKLSTAAGFYVKAAKSSNEAVLIATSSSNAVAANHTVTVNTLARGTTLASGTFGDTNFTTVGTGTLDITVGTTTTSIPISGTNNTLDGVRDAINNSGADVHASIVTVNAGATPSYRLVVSGKNTGLVNAVTVDESGLSGGTAPGFTETQAALDADLLVDGIPIARATNLVSDVIPGVTLDLKSAAPGAPVQVTVNNDTEAIKVQLDDFVAKYNDVMNFITEKTKFNSVTEQGGPLIGDSTLRTLRRSLQTLITTPSAGTPSILGEIGLATQKDGTLSVDGAKLSAALETNLAGVGNLFLAASGGLAKAIITYSDNAIRLGDGVLTARIDGAQNEIKNIDDRIAKKEEALVRLEQDLIRKFTSLETLVSQINTQGNFLAAQIENLAAQLRRN